MVRKHLFDAYAGLMKILQLAERRDMLRQTREVAVDHYQFDPKLLDAVLSQEVSPSSSCKSGLSYVWKKAFRGNGNTDSVIHRRAEPAISSHAYGVRFSRIHQPPVARYASLTGG